MRVHIDNKTELGDLHTHQRLEEIQIQCGTLEGVICRLQVAGYRTNKYNDNNNNNSNYNNNNNKIIIIIIIITIVIIHSKHTQT